VLKGEIILLLLEKGADIDAQDYQKYSPILMAAATERYDLVDLFLARGASVEAIRKEAEGLDKIFYKVVRSGDPPELTPYGRAVCCREIMKRHDALHK
jgi:hypothetical protein